MMSMVDARNYALLRRFDVAAILVPSGATSDHDKEDGEPSF
jgi:hypothetical protein